jgi:hypothetical protein
VAVEPEHVEHHVHHRLVGDAPADGGCAAGLHPRLQPLEARYPGVVEGDDLAVEQRVEIAERVREAGELGEAGGGVVAGP